MRKLEFDNRGKPLTESITEYEDFILAMNNSIIFEADKDKKGEFCLNDDYNDIDNDTKNTPPAPDKWYWWDGG